MESYSLEIFADYHQILIHDGMDDGDLSESWDSKAYNQMIAISKSSLAISTIRNINVPVEVIITENKLSYIADEWDHIIKCSLNISSGNLIIRGVSDYLPDARKITVTPGQYTVWLLYGGLSTISNDGMEGEDYYKVVLSRSELAVGLTVLKNHNLQ